MQGNLKINTIRLNINNINVQCYAAGDTGPPVILLHGAGVDSARISWELEEELARLRGYRDANAMIMDTRGLA